MQTEDRVLDVWHPWEKVNLQESLNLRFLSLCNYIKSFYCFLPNFLLTTLQVLYKNYFDTREKRKEEMDAYFESSFPKKGIKDLETSEYPVKGTNV